MSEYNPYVLLVSIETRENGIKEEEDIYIIATDDGIRRFKRTSANFSEMGPTYHYLWNFTKTGNVHMRPLNNKELEDLKKLMKEKGLGKLLE